ncbi:glutathione S-transferase [Shewanella schlegeliana]|uniref:Glutathione S-transferase n=1 Tax=Shewanella schlegeliana TaxID=190308 RepID=A0ABS1STK0_9GAMM|nr:glutathione S-transferase [Shewanella schlegeliana]MBL4911862.1 glutathione S-transferase [Shewanella schlegeliana]MCL1110185.1 glutathione S-transferase [Shewanella schlegeliana]GIU27113.1 glutathione S-transferase [Shewanella schlegeliana]
MSLPVLYSFRRCPYAMRARLGILLSGQKISLREIVLKHKPEAMLTASPKGTVPVLILQDGAVIEQSIEIMCWALMKSDPHNLLLNDMPQQQEVAQALIHCNDNQFKPWLDRYKYADRHPEHSEQYYRQQGEIFIDQLDSLLSKNPQLLGHKPCIADYAIYPFIRQFASVDRTWFDNSGYLNVQRWLKAHIESDNFKAIMNKYPTWLESGRSFEFG